MNQKIAFQVTQIDNGFVLSTPQYGNPSDGGSAPTTTFFDTLSELLDACKKAYPEKPTIVER